jgi:hypothetical protein
MLHITILKWTNYRKLLLFGCSQLLTKYNFHLKWLSLFYLNYFEKQRVQYIAEISQAIIEFLDNSVCMSKE